MDNYRELKIRCDPGFGHLPEGSAKLSQVSEIVKRKPVNSSLIHASVWGFFIKSPSH